MFGGTWEQIKDTFILAAGDTYKAGTTGGEATHILTTDEMPAHNHESPILGVVGGSNLKGDDPWANQVDSGRQAKDYYTKKRRRRTGAQQYATIQGCLLLAQNSIAHL